MESSKPDNEPDVTPAELVKALTDMRDALMQVSMALKDYQFLTNAAQRNTVAEATESLIDKVKAG